MISRVAIVSRSRLLVLATILVLLVGSYIVLADLTRADTQPTGYTGCVSTYTGAFRVLIHGSSCGSSEIPISFGATGPPGPQGPQGGPGPQGEQGPQGPAGTAAAALQAVNPNIVLLIPGSLVPFGPTAESFGSSIIQNDAGGEFTLLDAGYYRFDFSLPIPFLLYQQLSVPTFSVQFEKNEVPIGPAYSFIYANADLVTGSLLVAASPGDVISLRLTEPTDPPNPLFLVSGTNLMITQLSESSP
jgi:hypothetical protein